MNYFEQLDRLAAEQGGYFYPWRSALGEENGEDAYTALVEAHLAPDKVVLDAGCGHGSDMLTFAPRVACFIGYDAVAAFVDIARRRAAAAGLANVEMIAANSSARHNAGRARLPVADRSLDLVISRRGPSNWIADVPRACRPGARLIQINPLPCPGPDWAVELPAELRPAENPANPSHPDLLAEIDQALATAGLALGEGRNFDVPEVFDDPQELYRYLTFMRFEPDAPSWDEARQDLEDLLARHGPVDVRQRRYLWSAVVDER